MRQIVNKFIISFRDLLVKVTPPNSKLRHCLKNIYMYFPKRFRESYLLDKTIKTISKRNDIRFIQIGANDGIHCDPLYSYVKKKPWKGLMVEPNPSTMLQLKANHQNSKSTLHFHSVAIGEEGEFSLFWCREDSGTASTNRQHVEKIIGNKNFPLLEEKIQMMSFSRLVAEYPEFSNVHILLIDTEGWDGKIVQSIPFNQFRTDVLIFESAHLSSDELANVVQYLHQSNFECFTSRGDTTAIYRNPKLKELKKVLENSSRL